MRFNITGRVTAKDGQVNRAISEESLEAPLNKLIPPGVRQAFIPARVHYEQNQLLTVRLYALWVLSLSKDLVKGYLKNAGIIDQCRFYALKIEEQLL